MAEREEILAGGNMTAVVRVGNTVRRAAGPWTPTIHAFLRHLRANGFGLVPEPLVGPIGAVANALTVIAMAGLGLSVDIPAVARSGGRVIVAATLSLLLLGGMAYGVIRLLALA